MTVSRLLPALRLATAAGTLAVVGPVTLNAQVPDSLRVDSVRPVGQAPAVQAVTDSVRPPTSPTGAMLRSFLLPGWGQAEFDAYFRGGIYFAGWSANWFMNFRNYVRLDDARNRLQQRTDQIEARILEASTNPDSLQAVLDSFPGILADSVAADSLGSDLQGLVDSREQQREDWIAWSIFWVLASGIDAYVTAHLSDFPAEIELRPGRDRSVSLRVGVPVGLPVGVPRPAQRGARVEPVVVPALPPPDE